MKGRAALVAAALALAIAGCATPPTPVMPADEDYDPDAYVTPPLSPLIESPPVEPVEPPLPAPTTPAPDPATPPTLQPSVAPPPVVVAAPPQTEPTEDEQLLSLLADLQRFGTLQNDELKREIAAATQTLARQRTDVNRVRLAVLYTLLRASPQDVRPTQTGPHHPHPKPPPSRGRAFWQLERRQSLGLTTGSRS